MDRALILCLALCLGGCVTADYGPRPAKWCGFQMREWYGGGPELNIARNWAKVGQPTRPRVGAIVVWKHHVGVITGTTDNGEWIVKSGNDGGQVRERPRSIKNAIAVRTIP